MIPGPDTSIVISGLGMVTPLGWDTQEVWRRLCAGESGIAHTIEVPVTKKTHPCARVSGFEVDDIVRTGRVRRSSAISHYAVGAAALGLRNAKLEPEARIGVIVAVSIGAVSYSRRFHQELVLGGGKNVSPMLFPETVYNAPASHIAAVLNLTGLNNTVLGDSCSSANALAMAADFIGSGIVDQCLVVATEELDWIAVEGYRRFGLIASGHTQPGRMLPFHRKPTGFVAGEGAVAIVLESSQSASKRGITPYARLASVDRGYPFRDHSAMRSSLETAVKNGLTCSRRNWQDIGGVFCSANGTFVDAAEAAALVGSVRNRETPLPVTSAKASIGESHAASCLFQVASAALSLRHRQLPPTVGLREPLLDLTPCRVVTHCEELCGSSVLALCVGFNEQVSVIVLSET